MGALARLRRVEPGHLFQYGLLHCGALALGRDAEGPGPARPGPVRAAPSLWRVRYVLLWLCRFLEKLTLLDCLTCDSSVSRCFGRLPSSNRRVYSNVTLLSLACFTSQT